MTCFATTDPSEHEAILAAVERAQVALGRAVSAREVLERCEPHQRAALPESPRGFSRRAARYLRIPGALGRMLRQRSAHGELRHEVFLTSFCVKLSSTGTRELMSAWQSLTSELQRRPPAEIEAARAELNAAVDCPPPRDPWQPALALLPSRGAGG